MIAELRRIHRRRISRLRDLSVEVHELSAGESREALIRFAHAFVGVGGAEAFLAAIEAARRSHGEIEYGKWLWQGSPPPELRPRFGWHSDWLPGRRCIRFDRRVSLSALRLSSYTIPDEWVLSWPGVYVSFETGRAIVVSLDYEVTCFDLSAPPRPPYR